jgi:hypothetical protein
MSFADKDEVKDSSNETKTEIKNKMSIPSETTIIINEPPSFYQQQAMMHGVKRQWRQD